MASGKKTLKFHVSGMHCQACVLMTESELQDDARITEAKSDLETESVEVTGDFGDKDPSAIAEELTVVLKKHGYALSVERPAREKAWGEFRYALPISAALAVGFLALQKAGLVNLISGSRVTYGTAFVVGIVASLSSCLAVVGGLALSMSAAFAKGGERTKPQLLFHAGRLAAFFLLGGAIGAAGTVFQLNPAATLALGIAIGVVMLILGLNLLDVFDWAKRFQPAMPKALSRRALGISKLHHALTPLLLGIATFFLPCGFTQSMQLYTLTTGSFLKGGLTMLAFAIGTFPVLALVSFSSLGAVGSRNKGIFFKTAGILVILFAAFNVINALAAAGVTPPLFNF